MPDQPRILVVDDDFATRLLASEALLADGFSPVEAEDGHDALAHFDRQTPDAILLDIHMPGIDGYEVCRRIRQRPGGVGTSILVMTASDDVDAVERAFASGATDFLTKPLNLPLLAHRVRYMLRAAAVAEAARETASRLARAQRLARLVHWQVTGDQFAWASDPLPVFWPDAPPPVGEPPAAPHLLELVHPDDRDRVAAALARLANHQIDYRIRLPDGSERVVHQDAELELSERGVVLIGATQDITERKHAEQQIAQLAFHDDLTGIPNRPFAERYLRHVDPGPARTAIAIDLGTAHLDHLSVAARDVVIRAAAARVIERVRGADLELRLDQAPRALEELSGPTLVARTGTDELLVITTDLIAGSGQALTRQLAEAFAQPFPLAGRELVLRPRLGVADYPDPVSELHRLDDHARDALQDAERLAPRNVVVLTAAASAHRIRRGQLAHQLAATLDAAASDPHPDLTVDYLVRVEPRARQAIGVRARPRWLVTLHDAPALIQLLASDPVLRDRFARWTLAAACRDAARWASEGATPRLAVELPATLLAQPTFLAAFHEHATGAEPRLIDLELTDLPSADDELERIAGTLRELRALGVRTVLARTDDSCTMRELRRLPLDGLRVERPTMDRLGPTLLATVSTIARGLGLQLAVTEIDSPAALAALDPHEPHELSGGLFGPVLPASGVPGLLADPANLRPRRATLVRPAHAG